MQQPPKSPEDRPVNITNELAKERNRAAADRTLMAWIRTALSMIGFGFGIGQVVESLHKIEPGRISNPIHSARIFGGAIILLGILSLALALLEHQQILKRLQRSQFTYKAPLPLTLIVGILLLLIGLFAFIELLR